MPTKSKSLPTDEEKLLIAAMNSCVYWLDLNKVDLGHSIWGLKNHWYQYEPLMCNHPQQVAIKGAQMGWALDVETVIPIPNGYVTMQDISVGDVVFGQHGSTCNVTYASPTYENRECYKITFDEGTTITADAKHRWAVYNTKRRMNEIRTTENICKLQKHPGKRKNSRFAIWTSAIVPGKTSDKCLIDPYILGIWLGDGHAYSATICSSRQDYKNILKNLSFDYDLFFDKRQAFPNGVYIKKIKGLFNKLVHLGLIANKHIPLCYLRASADDRMSLMQGLIDSDGHIGKDGMVCFYNNNQTLTNHVFELAASLGYKPRKRPKNFGTFWDRVTLKRNIIQWEIRFHCLSKDVALSRFERKFSNQIDVKRAQETALRYIKKVEKIESVPVRCITVDSPDSLFLITPSYIATHNSEIWVLKTLHGLIHAHYPKGALYLFPTRDDVSDFSKARFDPLIANNPCIQAFVRDTDAKNIKKIGSAFLYLRGARVTKTVGGTKKSSSQLKTVPVDRIVFDERDEMDDAMVELALERISHSRVQEEMHLGTPTIPDYGVDRLYQNSDQRIWMIKCQKCGAETCLELEFPDCLIERADGRVYRGCIKCHEKIHPANGKWVPRYENRDFVGWWVGQMQSMYVKPAKILDLFRNPPNGNLAEVYNSKLGMAYIAAENRLTKNDVWACCGKDVTGVNSENPTAMGVDVGKNLTVVIGTRPDRNLRKVVKTIEVESFNDVHDLAKKFNVQCAVLDLYPETRKVREFQKAEGYQVFLCEYKENQGKEATWDEVDGLITVNRTEICDATHELVTNPGRLEIPRKSDAIEQYVVQMVNMAKILDENPDTGSRVYRYRKLGPDHFRHATNYFLLASDRISITSDRKVIGRFFSRRKNRTFMTA